MWRHISGDSSFQCYHRKVLKFHGVCGFVTFYAVRVTLSWLIYNLNSTRKTTSVLVATCYFHCSLWCTSAFPLLRTLYGEVVLDACPSVLSSSSHIQLCFEERLAALVKYSYSCLKKRRIFLTWWQLKCSLPVKEWKFVSSESSIEAKI